MSDGWKDYSDGQSGQGHSGSFMGYAGAEHKRLADESINRLRGGDSSARSSRGGSTISNDTDLRTDAICYGFFLICVGGLWAIAEYLPEFYNALNFWETVGTCVGVGVAGTITVVILWKFVIVGFLWNILVIGLFWEGLFLPFILPLLMVLCGIGALAGAGYGVYYYLQQ